MFGKKKKTNRLYYPTKSRWMTRKKRKSTVKVSRKKNTSDIKKQLKAVLKNALYLVVLGIIGVIAALFFVFSSYFAVREVQVSRDNFNIDSSSIENSLNKYIGKNIIFLPKSGIVKTVKDAFPEFVSVKVGKSLPNTIKIHLENHEIVANLKIYHLPVKEKEEAPQDFSELEKAIRGEGDGSESEEVVHPLEDEEVTRRVFDLDLVEAKKKEEEEAKKEIEQKCVINQIGQAIFDQEENLELITIVLRGKEKPAKDREHVLAEEEVEYLMEAIRYFNNLMRTKVKGVEFFAVERELHFKLDTDMTVWLTTEKDYKQQIDKLNIIYEEAELDKEDLVYIDLRIKEKVVYCSKKSRCAR